MTRVLVAAAVCSLLVACHAASAAPASGSTMPSPTPPRDPAAASAGGAHTPAHALVAVAPEMLCATHGSVAGMQVREPTVRAFARTSRGDAAELRFTFLGDSRTVRALASGELRRQLGLKLRAQDSCNVVYVMWRMDPHPAIEVQVKSNPGLRTHEECGANGYRRVHPIAHAHVPRLVPGASHALRAAIAGDALAVWIDGREVWRGALPDAARDLHGPAGLRSDNVAFDITGFAAPSLDAAPLTCKREDER